MKKVKLPKLPLPAISLPEVGVFGSLPVAVLCLVTALFSAFFPYWAESSLVQKGNLTEGLPVARVDDIYIGLFAIDQIPGSKTRNRGADCTRPLLWVCQSGYCLASCGSTSERREADIKALLSGVSDSSSVDDLFCTPCLQYQKTMQPRFAATTYPDPTPHMLRSSMLSATQAFLIIGIGFTFINIIFNAINIILTPVSAIVGIDGLVLWNTIAALCYLLVLLIWGAEYNMKLRDYPGISDTLRPSGVEWQVESSIGWCCLLLILPFLLHTLLAINLGLRQYRRYYSSKKRTEAMARVQVQDPTQGGTDMIF